MKTLEEFYKEVVSNADLKKEYISIKDDESMNEFLAKHGCDASSENLKEFMNKGSSELNDDELDDVAGGTCYDDYGRPIVTVGNTCDYWTADDKKEHTFYGCANCEYIGSHRTSIWAFVCNHPKRKYN